MNFGFSCFKKIACCMPQIYKWAGGSYVDEPLRTDSLVESFRRDVPLKGTLTPNVTQQGDWVYVAASDGRGFAIAADGSLWGWGRGTLGNGGNSDEESQLEIDPVFIDSGPWNKVDVSLNTVVGIKSDNTLWQWGQYYSFNRDVSLILKKATLRAILSAPIGGAEMLNYGKYSKTPTVTVEKRKVNPLSYPYIPSSWSTPSQDAGHGAVVEPVMNYTATNVPTPGYLVKKPGAGYTSAPTGTVTDGTLSINATVEMSYQVTKVNVTDGGGGYSSKPAVSLNSSVGTGGVAATAEVTKMGRIVTSATVSSGGMGYYSSPAVFVNGLLTDKIVANVEDGQVKSLDVLCGLRVDDDEIEITFLSATGEGAIASATSRMSHVVEVTVRTAGSGYSRAPRVTFTGGGGTGAKATTEVSGVVAAITLPSSPRPVFTGFRSPPTITLEGGGFTTPAEVEILSTGVVEGIKVVNGGSDYTSQRMKSCPVAIFTRQQGDRFPSNETNNAFALCYVEPSPVSSMEVIDGGLGYSTEFFGRVEPITVGAPKGSRVFAQAGSRVEDLSESSSTTAYAGFTLSGSSGWSYAPLLFGVNSVTGDKYQIPYVTVKIDGMPHPRLDLDVRFTRDYLYDGTPSGARAKVSVNASGEVSSATLLAPGEGYKYEPVAEVSDSVIYPAQVGSSLWKDVACTDSTLGSNWTAVAIGYSDSLLYHWGTGLGWRLPTRIGKRLVPTSGEYTNISSNATPQYDTYAWIRPPDFPGQQASGASVFYSRWNANTPRSAGTPTLTYTGSGYASAPQCEVRNMTFTVATYGPDACTSVFSQNNASYAIDTNKKLWLLNSTSPVPHGPLDTIDDVVAIDYDIVNGLNVPAQVVFDPVDVSRGKNWGRYEAAAYCLKTGGSGYGDQCWIKVVGTKHRWRIVERYGVTVRNLEKGGFSGTVRNTLHSSGTHTEGDYQPNVLFYGPMTATTWQGSVISPSTVTWGPQNTVASSVTVPPSTYTQEISSDGMSETVKSRDYYLSVVNTDIGTPVVVDPSGKGSGAVYELSATDLGTIQSGGSGPILIGADTTWDFASNGKYVPYGKTSSGLFRFFDFPEFVSGYGSGKYGTGRVIGGSAGFPFPAAEQKPYIAANGPLAVLPDQSMRLLPSFDKYSMVGGSTLPSHVQGDVELIVSERGTGYTEPVVAKFSDQPPGAAEISSTVDGKLIAVAVIERGSGYNAVPTFNVQSTGSGSGGTVTGVISGPLHSVTMTAAGSEYRVPPIVEFSQPGISATATATLNESGGVASVSITSGGEYRTPPSVTFTPVPDIESISVTGGGSGYSSPPSVVISGGYGSGATATSKIDGKVVSIKLTQKGKGYTSPPTVRISPPESGTPAVAAATLNTLTGEVESIAVTGPGSMYQSAPSVVIEGGGGSGALAYAEIAGPVASVTLTSRGSKYYEPPQVFFIGGGGSNAKATATPASPGSGAAATARINGELLYCTVTAQGSWYSSTPKIVVSGGDNIFIAEANSAFQRKEITATQRDEIISQYEPKCMARIAGPPTFTLVDGGQNYGTNSDQTRYAAGRASGYFKKPAFRVLGPDTQGTIRGFNSTSPDISNFDYGIYRQLDYNGVATAPTSTPPGGPLTAVSSAEFASVRFTSPPLAIPEDAHGIIARTSMRLCGIAIEFGASILAAQSIFSVHPGTYKSYRAKAETAVASAWQLYGVTGSLRESNGFYALSPGPLPRLLAYIKGLGLLGENLESRTRYQMQGFEFDELPSMSIESDQGSGATVQVSVGTDGLACGKIAQPGSGYGSLVKVVIKRGKTKVVEAKATPVMSNGRVVDIVVTGAGSGYTSPPAVVIHGGGGSGASATAVLGDPQYSGRLQMPSGVIRIDVANCGSGYTSAPEVTIVSQNKFFEELPAGAGTVRDDDITSTSLRVSSPKVEFLEFTGNADDSSRRMSICAYPIVDAKWSLGEVGLKNSACVFYDEGYLDSVTLESSSGAYSRFVNAYELPQFYNRLPSGVMVELSGQCKSPAAVDVVRPKWSNVMHGNEVTSYQGGSLIAVRDNT